jgi:hypothetical protein
MQQERSSSRQQAYIPKPFAIFCTLYFYGATLFIILFTALVAATAGRIGLFVLLPCYLLLAPCLWLYGHWVRLARYHTPVYEVTEEGVIDRASFPHGTVCLPFDNIVATKQINWAGFHGLAFAVKDRPAFYASLSGRHRAWAYINALFYGTPFVIWQAWSDVKLTDFQESVENNIKHESPFRL